MDRPAQTRPEPPVRNPRLINVQRLAQDEQAHHLRQRLDAMVTSSRQGIRRHLLQDLQPEPEQVDR